MTDDAVVRLVCGHAIRGGAGRAQHPRALAGCAVRCPVCAVLRTVVSVEWSQRHRMADGSAETCPAAGAPVAAAVASRARLRARGFRQPAQRSGSGVKVLGASAGCICGGTCVRSERHEAWLTRLLEIELLDR